MDVGSSLAHDLIFLSQLFSLFFLVSSPFLPLLSTSFPFLPFLSSCTFLCPSFLPFLYIFLSCASPLFINLSDPSLRTFTQHSNHFFLLNILSIFNTESTSEFLTLLLLLVLQFASHSSMISILILFFLRVVRVPPSILQDLITFVIIDVLFSFKTL